jgi:SAM-dependent methyltransferase
MHDLVENLGELRWTLPESDWRRSVRDVIRPHPVFSLTCQDPLTARCLTRPRGFVGDAVMLDMLYGRHAWEEPPAGLAAGILSYTAVWSEASQAVRWRRSLLARLIDDTALRFPRPSILSVACGHLREIEISEAARSGALGHITGLDQDAAALETARALISGLPFHARRASVRRILTGAVPLGTHHFVYAAGLFDYLEQSVATMLVRHLAAAVKPGGSVLIANFLRGVGNAGYMSAMMDWNLVYRTEGEFENLFESLDRSKLPEVRFFSDPVGYVRYGLARRQVSR